MYVGEYVAQRIEKRENFDASKIDKEKMKQLGVVGLSQGPLHHYTYLWMERLLPGNAPKTVGKKILSDQVRKLKFYWEILKFFKKTFLRNFFKIFLSENFS